MSKGNTFENDFLLLIFNATAIADLAENDTTSPATNLYVSLHTADVTESGNQESDEADYGDYARVAVVRSGSGWTVSGNAVTNAATISFPTCSSGSNTITHFAVGVAASGTGKVLYKGELDNPLSVSTGITPQFAAGELDITED